MANPLVDDWLGYHATGCKATDSRFSAWQDVDDLVHRDPEAGWALILELIAAASDDRLLANVAAGPPGSGNRSQLTRLRRRRELGS